MVLKCFFKRLYLIGVLMLFPQLLLGQATVDAANLSFTDRVAPASLVDLDLGDSLAYTKFSSYASETDLQTYVSQFGVIQDVQLIETIERVVATFGQHDRINSIRVALYLGNDMPGAAFVDHDGTAYLVVASSAVDAMRMAAGGREDALIAFLAHELSHIFRQSWGQLGSGQESDRSLSARALDTVRSNLLAQKRSAEINADLNSGQIAQALGVSIDDAVIPLNLFAPEEGNATYPSHADRKQYVERGWMMGCRNNPDNCAEASFDSAQLQDSARNNIVVGILELPDQVSEEFRASFGEVFYEVLAAAAQSHFQKRTSAVAGIDLKRLSFVPAVLPSSVNAALPEQAFSFGQRFEVVAIVNSDVDWDASAQALDIDSQFFVVGATAENQTFFEEYSRVEDTYRSPRRYAQRGQISTRWGNMAALAKAVEMIEELDTSRNAAEIEQRKETIRQLINLAVLDLRCPESGQSDELVSWIQNNAATSAYLTIDLDELCGF